MQTVILSVQGMTCGGCVSSVNNILNDIKGVESVSVSLEQARAEIRYNPAHTSVAELIEAVENAGFDAE